jgi:hypothetical protein
MKSKIKEMLLMMEELFAGEYDALKFSCDMEDFFCENYDAIEQENEYVATLLNENFPEICAEGEPGFDPTHMIEELKKVYEKVKAFCN